MMWVMERDWAALGRAFAAARRALKLTQAEVADQVDVTRFTVQAIERGEPRDKPTPTMRNYARLVGWTEGSVAAVLAGGEPTMAAAEAPEGDSSEARLPLRIVEELREGQLLDTQVLDLTPLGSSARMIVVVKGNAHASPEQLRQDLLAWQKVQRQLQDIGDDDEPPAVNGT